MELTASLDEVGAAVAVGSAVGVRGRVRRGGRRRGLCRRAGTAAREQMVGLLGGLVEKSIVRRERDRAATRLGTRLLETIPASSAGSGCARPDEEPRIRGSPSRVDERAGPVGRRRSTTPRPQAELFRRAWTRSGTTTLGGAGVLPAETPAPRRAAPSLLSTFLCLLEQPRAVRRPAADAFMALAASLSPDDSGPSRFTTREPRRSWRIARTTSRLANRWLARASRVARASDDGEAMALSLAWLSIPLAMAGHLTEAESSSAGRRVSSLAPRASRSGSWPSQAVATAAPCATSSADGWVSPNVRSVSARRAAISEEAWRAAGRCGYMCSGPRSQVAPATGGPAARRGPERGAGAATKHAIDDRAGLQLAARDPGVDGCRGRRCMRACRRPPGPSRARADGQRARGPGGTAAATSSGPIARGPDGHWAEAPRRGVRARPHDDRRRRGRLRRRRGPAAVAGDDGRQDHTKPGDPRLHETGAGDRAPDRGRDDQPRHRGPSSSSRSEFGLEAHATNMLKYKLGLELQDRTRAVAGQSVGGVEPVTPAAWIDLVGQI